MFQNRRQTTGHFWREWTEFLIDLRSMSHHVASSGRRTLSKRQSRFTPAAQETLAHGNTHPWRLNSRDTVPQEKESTSRKMPKKRHFFLTH